MGLTQSTTAATEVASKPVTNTSSVTVETKTVTEAPTQTVTEPVIETAIEPTKLSTIIEETKAEAKGIETPTETAPATTSGSEVFSRYVTPGGTKVEVAPVDVAPTADVVKKNKNKNKKNNNSKKD